MLHQNNSQVVKIRLLKTNKLQTYDRFLKWTAWLLVCNITAVFITFLRPDVLTAYATSFCSYTSMIWDTCESLTCSCSCKHHTDFSGNFDGKMENVYNTVLFVWKCCWHCFQGLHQTLRPLNTLNNKIFLCETVFEAPTTLNYPGNKEKWKIISESTILVFLLLHIIL